MTTILIKQLRRYRGLTTRQLADMSGISKSQITRIENNQQMPTIDTLCRLAEALQTPIDNTFIYHSAKL